MKLLKTKKGLALLATLVVVGASAFGAYAYYVNSGGTATGSGTVGLSSAWNVTATPFTGTTLYPLSGSQSGTSTVTNTSAGSQELTTITATIVAPTPDATYASSGPNACTTGDFKLTGGTNWVVASDGESATYAVGVDEAGTTPGPAGSATTDALTLVMRDLAQNQNQCQNAVPNVKYTVN